MPYKYESGKHDLEVLNILNEHMPWNFQGLSKFFIAFWNHMREAYF